MFKMTTAKFGSIQMLPKLYVLLSLIALGIWVVSFASPSWIQKDFVINVPGAALNLPLPLASQSIPLHVSSKVGLLKACSDVIVKIPSLPDKTTSECTTDGAQHWQYVAGGFGIACLVLAVVSLVLSTTLVFVTNKSHGLTVKFAASASYLMTTAANTVAIILYAINKEFQVKPPLPDRFEYDLYWAFFLAVTSAVLYSILTILNIGLICWSPKDTARVDPSVLFVKSTAANGIEKA